MKYPDDFIGKVIQGDCLEVMKQMPDKCVDLVLTDPPYGVNLDYDVYNDTEDAWYELMAKFIPEARRIAKMVIMPSCQIKRLEWIYKTAPPDWLICWYKGSVGSAGYVGFNDWEPHLVYGKIHTQMHDYFKATPEPQTNGHPCQKPLSWANWLISRALKEPSIVFDPFTGSGTTLVSAKQLGHKFIGTELSQKYCDIANQRLRQDTLL